MSLFKLSMLLFSSISFHLALRFPPSPSPNPSDRIMVICLRERIWRHAGMPSALFLKGMVLLASTAESMVIIGSLWDTLRLSDTISVLLNALGPAEASKLTVPFVLGASLVTAGGMVRLKSFQTLGPYFTFEQCIRKEHKLIKHGPYAAIRHPGYTGLMMCILGWWIVHGSPGSWLRESGVLGIMWIKVGLVSWCFLSVASIVTVVHRSTEEDRFLLEVFGKEWESWARRVKYKLVPFIY